ncbi:MAG: Biotin carboxyl carrier protein of acetyl-CoA carboxylase [uncultured Thermomicrobiales bacterium]|uniref:Biotin carboxyl carrier protein of acetyl-CoA carboxylase n=1 Tax=uncultured Thermomicrobiales bacterium TaxID=1645740 RepID=A0A6J4TKR4_9BACT|nr:MAG: Biotin carboxyl carrier protein of acetyl-CoA carboxylase [uncultured Thermomicrobiales bacterium]
MGERRDTSEGRDPLFGATGLRGHDPEPVIEAVGTLIALMGRGGIHELDLSFADVTIRLRGQPVNGGANTTIEVAPVVLDAPVTEAVVEPLATIAAPMIGTFYASPAPGEPPFVRVGDYVDVGQTIGIIEAMKIMNEIAADHAGVVREVLIATGQAVEYGSPLLRVATEATVIA